MDDETNGWTLQRVLTCAGSVLMVSLVAFESVGVATAMPTVARALGASDSVPVAFAVPLAASIVAMVCAGAWADRVGPRRVLLIGLAMFIAGLVVAGAAKSMPMLIVGRIVQGVGGGLQTVALYVVIAKVFPERLRSRVFVLNSTAWIAPAVFGPPVAGAMASSGHWRWVFDVAALLAVPALLLMVPVLARLSVPVGAPLSRTVVRRALAATGAAVGAFALSMCASLVAAWMIAAAVGGVLLVAVFAPRVMPAGTYRAERGLPSIVLIRGLLGSAFIGGEVMLPLLLSQQHGLSATGAGVVLTVGGVAWSLSAWVSGRISDHDGMRRIIRVGFALMVAGTALCIAGAASSMPTALIYAGWLLTGSGIGLAYSPVTVLMMASSPQGQHGVNSAALQTNETLMTAVVVAVGAALFGQLAGWNRDVAFIVVLSVALSVAVAGLWVSGRLKPARTPSAGDLVAVG